MKGLAILCVFTAIALVGCKGRAKSSDLGPLGSLALDPSRLPAECHLSWLSRPMPLSVATEADRKYFKLLAGFSTGPDHQIDMSEVEAGLSNVYDRPAGGYAVVAFTVRFRSLKGADAFRQVIQVRAASDPAHFQIIQRGRTVTEISRHPSVPDSCVAPLRAHLERRGPGPRNQGRQDEAPSLE